ncbi:hypothetical protein [Microbacterium sp. 22242]|uniref:hypothetical protein n=1 Tax=Microbacterium sp. 22242 TaxID=3453896 RepID=UPI003F83B610
MAEAQGITIAKLIELAAHRLVTGSRPTLGPTAAERHYRALEYRVLALRARGLTIAAIAVEVGYSKSYVHRILTDATTKKRPNGQEAGKHDR